jgi:hypothetical protein
MTPHYFGCAAQILEGLRLAMIPRNHHSLVQYLGALPAAAVAAAAGC